jgi:hypothetical protein
MSTVLVPDVVAKLSVRCRLRHAYSIEFLTIEEVLVGADEKLYAIGQIAVDSVYCKICGSELEVLDCVVNVTLITDQNGEYGA